jgi:hypothetical protein
MKKVVTLVLLIILCVFGAEQNIPIPVIKATTFPTINVENSTYMGEQMIYNCQTMTGNFLRIYNSKYPNMPGGDGIYVNFRIDTSTNVYWYYKLVDGGVKKSEPYRYYKSEDKIRFNEGLLTTVKCSQGKYENFEAMYDTTITVPNTFQQSIEYVGKSGTTVKFCYKEFSESMARPAFTTQFEIDISETNIIRFKGAVLKIISVTGSDIKYEVIKGFD